MSATDDRLLRRAEAIAEQIMAEAAALESRADRHRRRQIAAAVSDRASGDFLADVTDEVLRIGDPRRAARRLHDLVAEHGAPAYATRLDRFGIAAAGRFGPVLPRLVVPLVEARLRRELSEVILPAGPRAYGRHARRRRAQGIRLNANLLGEAILGDGEAEQRLAAILALLARADVDYVSVKISAICAQIDVLAYEDSVSRIAGRLRRIYDEAGRSRPPKFVNLDMEEYRDLHLTIDAFERVLAEAPYASLDAGIVLQAYLPDAFAVLEEVAAFARRRYSEHGGTVKVRLVKGANLSMERVEGELRGWPQAPFTSKAEVDANYKRLLDAALDERNAGALRVGAATHNVFDIGWALALREASGARLEIEMLEGMANAQALATRHVAGGVLLYAPVVERDDFASAVAYLVRRFEENTSQENFLAHLFDLSVGSPEWEDQRRRFRAAVKARVERAQGPRRTQDRAAEAALAPGEGDGAFANTPDTDFSLAANRRWIAAWLDELRQREVCDVSAVVDGVDVLAPLTGRGEDPSSPGSPFYRYVQADVTTIDRAVAAARRAAPSWCGRGADERRRLLRAVAQVMGRERGRTLATMARDAGKTIGEGDPEVSEAVDFARYYGDRAGEFDALGEETRFEPFGVVVVSPPWNFPYAIPAGGVFASLAAGNTVILKPAPETVLTASLLAHQCWEGGIPKDVLQFLPCADGDAGRHLVTHEGVDAVILTGAWETARMFLEWRPSLELRAETSGKNAMVVTAAADEDDAIRDLVRSAFGHAGQKCSAASLAILEAPVYDDERFMRRLADAVASLRVGRATDPASQVGPLIRPPAGPLLRVLTVLAPGEEWLVEPAPVGDSENLWHPGVKVGVRPQSEFHLTECFGPVLGVMRADDLDHALVLQNGTGYGLTGGIHTLDPAEIEHWCAHVEVGNAYVNRVVTGAIVGRQPFGGWRRSAVGALSKTGGPHYVSSLGRWRVVAATDADAELAAARREWERLSSGEDPTGLRAEQNLFRLRSIPAVSLRLGCDCVSDALPLALAIAALVGARVDVSAHPSARGAPVGARLESDERYLERLAGLAVQRVRLCAAGSGALLAAIDAGLEVDTAELSPLGPVELLHWTREQVLSITRHRHGRVRLDSPA